MPDRRILCISSEAHNQDALLTQADIAILIGKSAKTVARQIAELEQENPPFGRIYLSAQSYTLCTKNQNQDTKKSRQLKEVIPWK